MVKIEEIWQKSKNFGFSRLYVQPKQLWCNASVFAHLAGKVDAVVDGVEIDLVVNLLQVLLNRLLDQ